jgi:hypothetical protein
MNWVYVCIGICFIFATIIIVGLTQSAGINSQRLGEK